VDELARAFTATTDPEHLAAYARVCGYRFGDTVPPTWPHILAFGQHMALMNDGRFPLPAIGLVHIANRIEQRRPIRASEELEITVEAEFKRPILLPGSVGFGFDGKRFSVRDARDDTPHLEGSIS